MHVNSSPKFVRMHYNFVAHANGNKRRACMDGRAGGGYADLVGWCRGQLGLVWSDGAGAAGASTIYLEAQSFLYIYTHADTIHHLNHLP
jgi:hypothetical protein